MVMKNKETDMEMGEGGGSVLRVQTKDNISYNKHYE